MLLAIPHRNEAITNAIVDHTNNLRSPKRRASQPVSGNAIAVLTANEVITHVAWLALPPRLPEMVGNETLAMVVSSTCMKLASASPSVVNATFGGRNAAGLAVGWPPGGLADASCAMVDMRLRLRKKVQERQRVGCRLGVARHHEGRGRERSAASATPA